jgi:hypothetical protein
LPTIRYHEEKCDKYRIFLHVMKVALFFKEKCNQESEIIVICTTSYESHTFFHEFAD